MGFDFFRPTQWISCNCWDWNNNSLSSSHTFVLFQNKSIFVAQMVALERKKENVFVTVFRKPSKMISIYISYFFRLHLVLEILCTSNYVFQQKKTEFILTRFKIKSHEAKKTWIRAQQKMTEGMKWSSENVPAYTFIRRSFNFNGSSSFECKVLCGVYCRLLLLFHFM